MKTKVAKNKQTATKKTPRSKSNSPPPTGPATRTRAASPKVDVEDGSEEGEIKPKSKKKAPGLGDDFEYRASVKKTLERAEKAEAAKKAEAADKKAAGRAKTGAGVKKPAAAPAKGKGKAKAKYSMSQSQTASDYRRMLVVLMRALRNDTESDKAFDDVRKTLRKAYDDMKVIAARAEAAREAAAEEDTGEDGEESDESPKPPPRKKR